MIKYEIIIKNMETGKEETFEAIDYIFACIIKKENGINYSDGSFSPSKYLDLTRLHLQMSELILKGFRENIKENKDTK